MIHFNISVSGRIHFDLDDVASQSISQGAAMDLQAALQTHFEGIKSRTFYPDAARSVFVEPDGEHLCVNIYKRGVKLQWLGSGYLPGGVIKPSGKMSEVTKCPIKSLSIPTKAAPYGKSIFESRLPLAFIPTNKRPDVIGVLVGATPVIVKRGKRKGQTELRADKSAPIFYVLMSQATITPHPLTMLSADDMRAAVGTGASDALQLILSHQS